MCAAGRRQHVTLGKILKFATGRETEPVFGFTMEPQIIFDADITIPRANTCTCTLKLPVLTTSYDLDRLDLAFVNDYFGQM